MKLKKFFLPKYKTQLERVGGDNDGGYPMSATILKKINYLICIGLGDDWSFEESATLYNKNLKVIMFDAQINKLNWIKKIVKEFFQLFKLKLNINKILNIFLLYFKYLIFFNKKNISHIKKNVTSSENKRIKNTNEKNLKEILFKRNKNNIILKIDIEGYEYRILDDILKHQKIIEFLIIEFHDVDLMEEHIKKFIKKLKLDLVHVHVNNFGGKNKNGFGKVVEAFFSKRKYNKIRKKMENIFPNKLYDRSNDTSQNDFKVIFK